ncbi:DUF4163 domain-containing protein [Sphingobium sp.]|uniref:DUF4163 domain-containing protein n=1 Tax=Sphingobium sp. TaxID=1912891 RepID=UPI003BB7BFA1
MLMTAVLAVAACKASPDAQNSQSDNASARRFVEKMAGAQPVAAPPAKPFARKEADGLLEFAYAYPAQAAAIPKLVAKFEKDMEMTRADALKMAKDDRDSAKTSGFPYHTHSLETEWTVAGDTPRFLSLQAQTYVFTGGAHGMTAYEALLWDKARLQETSVKTIMTSEAAFAEAIRARFCKALDKERAEKRGAPVVRGNDEFTQCIDPMKEVVALTSKDGKAIDGVTVIVGPYSAGPYAEGSYEIALPVDAAMLSAIKTDYRDAFVKP